jgi:hypothetical protein
MKYTTKVKVQTITKNQMDELVNFFKNAERKYMSDFAIKQSYLEILEVTDTSCFREEK